MRMFVCADSFTPPTILAIKLIALFRLALTTHHLGYSADHTEHPPHSMATANLKKSEDFVTNTTAASKYIPWRLRISIN